MNFAKFLRTPFYRTSLDDCFWIRNSRLENTILGVMYAVGFDLQYVFSKYKCQGLCWSNANIVLCISVSPTKGSNTLTQFVSSCRRILWVCLIILWGWRIKGYITQCNINNINNFVTYSFEQVFVSWVWDHKVTEATTVGVLWKNCFWKFVKVDRKTPVPESLFLTKL